jgi:hypothetical protein
VPIASYSGFTYSSPCSSFTAVTTRTGPQPRSIMSRYFCGSSSLPSLSTDRLITCHRTSTGLTFSTSIIQRDVIHAHGHMGSNQKSAT